MYSRASCMTALERSRVVVMVGEVFLCGLFSVLCVDCCVIKFILVFSSVAGPRAAMCVSPWYRYVVYCVFYLDSSRNS
jgi:hypothetical protein